MPALAGIKRLREDYDDDTVQFQDAVVSALSASTGNGRVEAAVKALAESGNLLATSPANVALGLRVVLQHIVTQAGKTRTPLMTYSFNSTCSPAAQTLLSAAVSLAKTESINAGEVFQLVEDVVETNTTEDVKACFNFMENFWGELRQTPAKLTLTILLRFQKACNMFTRRVSNNQDAEVLGAVALEVAKMLPFNDRAGLNAIFVVNQHKTPMDEEAGASVDGSEPIDFALYQQLWELQSAFQDPHDQADPDKWAKSVSSIQAVLSKLKEEPTGVASRSTAVPQDGGRSVIVKYLTSSKLTKLQLRDAAFRRTLLVQCLVLLHACEHPRIAVGKPSRQLIGKQIPELAQLQQQIYDELSRTPEQGPAFTNVVKALLERETAFVKWKSEGAVAYWEASGPGPQAAPSLERALPKLPPPKPTNMFDIGGMEPDTTLDLDRMWDTSGAEEDVYRQNRDQQMLPTTDQHLAQVGKELEMGNFRKKNQFANASAPGGVDPLYLFRAQRMLQRKSIDIWERTTQMDSPAERLEIAFADLYPNKVPSNWQKPKIELKSPIQTGVKKGPAKASVTRTASDASEGIKQQADTVMAEVTPTATEAVEPGAENATKSATDMTTNAETANVSKGDSATAVQTTGQAAQQAAQEVAPVQQAADEGVSKDGPTAAAQTTDQAAQQNVPVQQPADEGVSKDVPTTASQATHQTAQLDAPVQQTADKGAVDGNARPDVQVEHVPQQPPSVPQEGKSDALEPASEANAASATPTADQGDAGLMSDGNQSQGAKETTAQLQESDHKPAPADLVSNAAEAAGLQAATTQPGSSAQVVKDEPQAGDTAADNAVDASGTSKPLSEGSEPDAAVAMKEETA